MQAQKLIFYHPKCLFKKYTKGGQYSIYSLSISWLLENLLNYVFFFLIIILSHNLYLLGNASQQSIETRRALSWLYR